MPSQSDLTKKRMRIMLISMVVLFGAIFIYKGVGSLLLKYFISHQSRVIEVSVMKAEYFTWQPQVKASGSVRALRGVNITTELAGMVKTIYFTPGQTVKEGDVLVQLNADTEIGQLQALQAQAALAKITYDRDQQQFKVRAVSKQTIDSDYQNLQNLTGQVAQQAATVAKKTIRAPFAGRLGINLVNPGQYLNTGDPVVMLQTMDPVWVDFYVPQQFIPQLGLDLPTTVSSETFLKDKTYSGKITTINPGVDTNTRNLVVEATIPNPQGELIPGMFVSVIVDTGKPQQYITLPQTAVTFNPYGDIVFIVHETPAKKKDKKGKPILTVAQKFVKTGEIRGDQVAILDGLNAGDVVVTSGQLKLKNGSEIEINNSVVPENQAQPTVIQQ